MTYKERTRTEIEKAYNEALNRTKLVKDEYWEGKVDAYRNVLCIFDSMQEEPVSEDLDRAAMDYALKRQREEGSSNDFTTNELEEAFEVGAQWQKQRDNISVSEDLEVAAKLYAEREYDRKNPSSLPWQCKGCYAPLMYAFKDGAKWKKQEMMEDAVKGTVKFVGEGTDKMVKFVCGNLNPDEYELNQRVKLIIIKEESV